MDVGHDEGGGECRQSGCAENSYPGGCHDHGNDVQVEVWSCHHLVGVGVAGVYVVALDSCSVPS